MTSTSQPYLTQSITQGRENDSIKIRLECLGPAAQKKHAIRHLTLRPGRPIIVGRSSKSSNKNLAPAPDNAFFDCPVMSRNHAELEYETGYQPRLRLKDTQSLHGTFLNHQKVLGSVYLVDGSTIRFGDAVARQQSFFHGIEVRVAIDDSRLTSTSTTLTGRTLPSTNTFRVPSDSGDDAVQKRASYSDWDLSAAEAQDEDDTPSDYAYHDDDDDGQYCTAVPIASSVASPVASMNRTYGSRHKSAVKDSMPRELADHPSSGSTKLDPLVIDDPSPSPASNTEFIERAVTEADLSEEDFSDADVFSASDDEDLSEKEDEDDEDQDEEEEDQDDEEKDQEDDDDEQKAEDDQVDVARVHHSYVRTKHYDQANDTLVGVDALVAESVAGNNAAVDVTTSDEPLNIEQPADVGAARPRSTANPTPTQSKHTPYPASRMLPQPKGFDLTKRIDAMRANGPLPPILEFWPAYYRKPKDDEQQQQCQQALASMVPEVPQHNDHDNRAHYDVVGDAAISSQARQGKKAVGVVSGHKDTALEPSESVGSENKKRKRPTEDESLSAMDWEMLLNPPSTTDGLPTPGSELEKTAVDELVDIVSGSSSSRVDVSENVTVDNDQVKSCIAKLKVPSMADGRPRKKARVGSVSLALTAAAGAVGGCVATVSFLWSPLAERLLA